MANKKSVASQSASPATDQPGHRVFDHLEVSCILNQGACSEHKAFLARSVSANEKQNLEKKQAQVAVQVPESSRQRHEMNLRYIVWISK